MGWCFKKEGLPSAHGLAQLQVGAQAGEHMKTQDIFKIAAGVALGLVIAGSAAYAFRLWMINRALEGITQTAKQSAQQIMESSTRQIEAAKEAEHRRKLEQVRLEMQARIDAEQREQAVRKAAQVREAAWNRYYQRPKHCDDAVGNAFVECGNHYIRAKRKFDELYDTGKL